MKYCTFAEYELAQMAHREPDTKVIKGAIKKLEE